MTMTGYKELMRTLDSLKKGDRNKILRPAVLKAAKEAAQIVKSKIPPRYKDVRAAIGSRLVKARYTKGEVVAKVGASVGKQKQKSMFQKSRDYNRSDKSKRKGVGISSNNIHWWFLGTGRRWNGVRFKYRRTAIGKVRSGQVSTGNKVRYTGVMKPQEQPVIAILAPHASRMHKILSDEIRTRLFNLIGRRGGR